MRLHLLVLASLSLLNGSAQSNFCQDDPPVNPFIPDSPWPTYHRNDYRQASTCLAGPTATDSLQVIARRDITGGTSPWTCMTDAYPDGSRAFIQSNSTHLFKFLDGDTAIITVDSLRIDFDPITSFSWSFVVGRNMIGYTVDPKYNPGSNQYTRVYKFGDADPTDPFSELVYLDTIDFRDHGLGKGGHLSMTYTGEILFNCEAIPGSGVAIVGVLSPDLDLLDTLHVPLVDPDEITYHNSMPVDEDNRFYIGTTHRLIAFAWDGTALSIAWQAPYDFVFDGPTGTFAEGSGTTPTLMGWLPGEDKLILLCDGHARNNMVAFWRELPPDWTGVAGMDIHFADSLRLPAAVSFGNLFQSIENSPCARGYDIAVAQFNGFLGQPCPTVKGVQKLRWDTLDNSLSVQWVNNDVNLNGVLTYSSGSGLLYGAGREDDCDYYYYGLDWEDGSMDLRLRLGGPADGTGTQNPWDDGGNGHVIEEDGDLWFCGGRSLVKLRRVPLSTSLPQDGPSGATRPMVWCDAHGAFNMSAEAYGAQVQIFDAAGRLWHAGTFTGPFGEALGSGLYVVRWQLGEQAGSVRVVKP